ncbi:MAG: Jag N-terminal domain-containing protein [Clostridiales bacterium]|jgi:spoIIIJ-associated protein|nr:Jag N-terminal domain-containing protein [Clostridiales bacterium]
MNQVEVTAKKLDDAISEGLKQLNATMDEVNVEVLEQGGFFKKAKVRLTLSSVAGTGRDGQAPPPAAKASAERPAPPKKEERKRDAGDADFRQKEGRGDKKEKRGGEKADKRAEPKPEHKKRVEPSDKQSADDASDGGEVFAKRYENAPIASHRPAYGEDRAARRPLTPVTQPELDAVKSYIDRLLPLMGVEGTTATRDEEGVLFADIQTGDSVVIGHRGEVLDALQILCKRAAESAGGRHAVIRVDSQNYRARREESLVALANRQAEKCIKTGRKVILEPMSSAHRKIVHATLNDNQQIVTRSEGREPNRRIVILPKRD